MLTRGSFVPHILIRSSYFAESAHKVLVLCEIERDVGLP